MEKKDAKKLAAICAKALDEKKAVNLDVIEIEKISPLADYFVIASGTNANQTDAMSEAVQEAAERAGFAVDHVEGHRNGNWILIDLKAVVVHIFDEEAREFYGLENLWRDGVKVEINELLAEIPAE